MSPLPEFRPRPLSSLVRRPATLDDVIEHARLSGKSHFYHYFRSKDQLGLEVLSRQFERFADRGLAILREPMIDPLDRLHLFIDSLVALQVADGGRSGSPFGRLAAELASGDEGFRARLAGVFVWFLTISTNAVLKLFGLGAEKDAPPY